MRELFDIIDPMERFAEARDEAVSDGVESATQGRRISPNQALWLAGTAIFAISTLILMSTLSTRIEGEFASRVNNESGSDTAPQHYVSSREPASNPLALPATPPRAQSVHAIDPEASAAQSSESQVETSQKPAALSTVTSSRQAAAVESSSSAQSKDQGPATPAGTEAPSRPGLGDQLLKVTSGASIRNGPSASADIIGTAYAGAEVRVASRDSGWTQIVDPSSGNRGWIDSTVLAPLAPNVEAASTEDSTPEDQPAEALNEPPLGQDFEIPDEGALSTMIESTPGAKAKKHGSKRHYGRRGLVVRFNLRRFSRR